MDETTRDIMVVFVVWGLLFWIQAGRLEKGLGEKYITIK